MNLFEIVRRNILLYKTVDTPLKFFWKQSKRIVSVIWETINWFDISTRTGGNILTPLPEPAT